MNPPPPDAIPFTKSEVLFEGVRGWGVCPAPQRFECHSFAFSPRRISPVDRPLCLSVFPRFCEQLGLQSRIFKTFSVFFGRIQLTISCTSVVIRFRGSMQHP